MKTTMKIVEVTGEEQNLNDVLTYLIQLSTELRSKSLIDAAEKIESVVCNYQSFRVERIAKYSDRGYLIPLIIVGPRWSAGPDQGYIENNIVIDIEPNRFATTILAMRQARNLTFTAGKLRRV